MLCLRILNEKLKRCNEAAAELKLLSGTKEKIALQTVIH
jgi:hypothetical protein